MTSDRTLISEEIEARCVGVDEPLIKPFDPQRLKPAAYDLTVGKRAWLIRSLDAGDDAATSPLESFSLHAHESFDIPPGHVALVETLEHVRLPGDFMGRVSLKNKQAVRRLSYHGGVVDPGFFGTLLLPVTNLGQTEQRLEFGQRIATIQVVQLGRVAEENPATEPRQDDEVLSDWANGARAPQFIPVPDLSRQVTQLERDLLLLGTPEKRRALAAERRSLPLIELTERLTALEDVVGVLGDRRRVEEFRRDLDHVRPRLEVQQSYMAAVVFGAAAGALGAAVLGSVELLQGELDRSWALGFLFALLVAILTFPAVSFWLRHRSRDTENSS